MDKRDITVTSMEHHIIKELGPAPLGDLMSKAYDGNTSFHSYDAFRRLYNDALESLQETLRIISSLEAERNRLSEYCTFLENAIYENLNE